MKIVQQISASLLAATFATTAIPQMVKANPAALAVPAICAGTTGVGCVLVGVGIAGAVIDELIDTLPSIKNTDSSSTPCSVNPVD